MTKSGVPRLVLASTSKYRRVLLDRLGLRFEINGSMVDEAAKPGEDPVALSSRLARDKAQAVADRFPQSVIIGSDQVAVLGRTVLGKPGSIERCIEQLKNASGQRVLFQTAVHVLDLPHRRHDAHVDTTTVQFRELTDTEIRNYIELEKPLDCAGGFKAESLGIALFERIDSQDPTALIGLPLIWLAGALRRAGFALP
jgi:septum formation protein